MGVRLGWTVSMQTLVALSRCKQAHRRCEAEQRSARDEGGRLSSLGLVHTLAASPTERASDQSSSSHALAMSDTPQPVQVDTPEPTADPRKARLAAPLDTQPAPAPDTDMPQEPQQTPQAPAAAAPAPADLVTAPGSAANDCSPLAQLADPPAPPHDVAETASSAPVVPEQPVETSAPEPESQTAASSELDAAVPPTLAMDIEPASETAAEPSSSAAAGAGPAEAAAASIGREATSTPTTIYNQAASAGDVPAAVATPPPPSAPAAADASAASAVNGSGADAPRSKAAAAATSGLSRVAQLAARVEKDPLDGEAQLALLQDAESKGDLERTREVYEKFLAVFPDAVSPPSPPSLSVAHRPATRSLFLSA